MTKLESRGLTAEDAEGAEDSASAQHGFTLIELLVVVVIIGILIAIAIPVYQHFQQGAYEASVKSDLTTLRLEEQNYQVSEASFASTRQLVTANPKLKLSSGSGGAVVWSSNEGYCVAATNSKGPADRSAPFAYAGFAFKTYFYDSTTGRISTTSCMPGPQGATGLDGYVDDSGFHG